jgi:hypothetical protein
MIDFRFKIVIAIFVLFVMILILFFVGKKKKKTNKKKDNVEDENSDIQREENFAVNQDSDGEDVDDMAEEEQIESVLDECLKCHENSELVEYLVCDACEKYVCFTCAGVISPPDGYYFCSSECKKKLKDISQHKWASNNINFVAKQVHFKTNTRKTPKYSNLLDCFLYLFDSEIENQIVLETNRYGKSLYGSGWKNLNTTIFRYWLCAVLYISNLGNVPLKDLWSSDWVVSNETLHGLFPREWFLKICRGIHYVNSKSFETSEDSKVNKLFKLGPKKTGY